MNKFLSLIFVILGVLFLFGCTSAPTTCGDLVCQAGEELTCPTDCASAVEGQIELYVDNPYDAEEVYVYWHRSSNISSNISTDVTSRLAEHWSGSEYRNLYMSFSDEKSGEIPLEEGQREIVINNLVQGEYYFEARTSDYSYRGVSEKVLVKDDGTYEVYLDLVPSNPAVRVKAYDKSYDNVLEGPAKITATIIEERYEYGEYTTEEYVFDVRTIKEDAEINELFFVPSYYFLRDDRYYMVNFLVEKDGYEDYSFNFRPYRQYSEYGISMKELPEPGTGNLEVQITPGEGTTWDDVYRLSGVEGQLCGGPDYECYYSEINGYRVLFDDIPAGTYEFNANKGFNSEEKIAPISTHTFWSDKIVITDGDNLTVSQQAILGYLAELNIFDSEGSLIDLYAEPVYILQSCQIGKDFEQCYNNTENTKFPSNPYYFVLQYSNQDYLESYLDGKLILTLEYKGEQKDFEINYGQGYDELNWQFDGNISLSKPNLFNGNLTVTGIQETIPKHSYFSEPDIERALVAVYEYPENEVQVDEIFNANPGQVIDLDFETSNTNLVLEGIFYTKLSRGGTCGTSDFIGQVSVNEYGLTTDYEVNIDDVIDANLPFPFIVDFVGVQINTGEPFIRLINSDNNINQRLDINESITIVDEFEDEHNITFSDLIVPSCVNRYSGIYSYSLSGIASSNNSEKWVGYVTSSSDLAEDFRLQENWKKFSIGEIVGKFKGGNDYSGYDLSLILTDVVGDLDEENLMAEFELRTSDGEIIIDIITEVDEGSNLIQEIEDYILLSDTNLIVELVAGDFETNQGFILVSE